MPPPEAELDNAVGGLMREQANLRRIRQQIDPMSVFREEIGAIDYAVAVDAGWIDRVPEWEAEWVEVLRGLLRNRTT